MKSTIIKSDALDLLKQYNKDPFHILHGLTVASVMAWFAEHHGHAEDSEYWEIVGLLHDIDYEMFPEAHCVKCEELLSAAGVSSEMIYSISSHGYGLCSDKPPVQFMEKVLFATDELTGLIQAAVRMRPSKSAMDLEVSSLKKKFKDKRFAAGCSREVIEQGASMLGWELETLLDQTILAMRDCEAKLNEEMASYQ